MTPVVIGNATLYLGNCMEVLPTLERPAAIVTDPPYGQNLNTNVSGRGQAPEGKRRAAAGLHRTGEAAWFPSIKADDKPFDPTWMLTSSDRVLMWGAHKFGDRLPRGRWLAWDKVPTGKVRDQGDGELAWTNIAPDAVLRIFRLLWDGICVDGAVRHEVTSGVKRVHPTQKPVLLMQWCLQFVGAPAGGVICDPYMGAGSTGIAALLAGHPFVGIELEPTYFDAACLRVEEAQRQTSMFPRQPLASSEQMEMHAQQHNARAERATSGSGWTEASDLMNKETS